MSSMQRKCQQAVSTVLLEKKNGQHY